MNRTDTIKGVLLFYTVVIICVGAILLFNSSCTIATHKKVFKVPVPDGKVEDINVFFGRNSYGWNWADSLKFKIMGRDFLITSDGVFSREVKDAD